ncbi:MAG: ATP synthase F0 subunit B [Deltaproteobacteria bacterium]|nr:ATP synthase F0 subunit B [Deltaproteobacteria bacterium]
MLDLTSLTTLLLATPEAEHGAHGAFNWFQLGSMFFNFVVFFGFLAFVIRKPLATFLVGRREKMAEQLRDAQSKQAAAEKRLSEYAARLANLEDEVRRVVQAFEAEGRAEAERLRVEGERAMERLKREVDFTLRQESLKAIKEIRAAGVDATLGMAESLISERITDADRRRLTDDYIKKLTPGSTSLLPKGEAS